MLETIDRLLRLEDIVGQSEITEAQAARNRQAKTSTGKNDRRGRRPRPAIRGIIPMSRSSWWRGVKDGRFPPPDLSAPGIDYWRESTIAALLESMTATHREAA